MKKLLDICEVVTSGQIMSRVAADDGKPNASKVFLEEARAILPKAIAGGAIDDKELANVQLVKTVDASKRTSVGDIIVKLSTPYDCAVVAAGQENLIATSFCALIKGVHPNYLPEFVCAYLNTPMMKDKLKSSITGAQIPLLRVGDLKAVDIPDIAIDTQRKAVEALQINAHRRKILTEMLAKCDELDESIVMTVVEQEAQNNG